MFKHKDRIRLIQGRSTFVPKKTNKSISGKRVRGDIVLTFDRYFRNNYFYSLEYPGWVFDGDCFEPVHIQEFNNKLDLLLEK